MEKQQQQIILTLTTFSGASNARYHNCMACKNANVKTYINVNTVFHHIIREKQGNNEEEVKNYNKMLKIAPF